MVLASSAAFLLVAAVVDGDWLRAVLFLAVAAVFGAAAWRSRGEDRRQSRSTALARGWPPARVRALSAEAGGQHIATVKHCAPPPERTLRDAHELVRQAVRQDAPSD